MAGRICLCVNSDILNEYDEWPRLTVIDIKEFTRQLNNT